MEAQDEQVYASTMPDVTAALLDFARLSQRAGSVVSAESGLIAMKLLERLLTLFAAQRGAILLTTQDLHEAKQFPLSLRSSRRMFRFFACSDVNEEEAMTLLANFSLEGVNIQDLPGKLGWLICRLPIAAPLTPVHDDASTELSGQTTLPLYALVLLGWTVPDESVREHARMVMPGVADAFGSALLSVLLAERIRELETVADRKALREMELLKAELLATVSHELRSPLASIKGYAATLLRHERRISREERHEFLLAINEASDRLAVVIDRLLEVSQLETGTIVLDYAAVNVAHLAREAIIAVEERMLNNDQLMDGSHKENRHFTFSIHTQGWQDTEEPIVQADRLRLCEVLDNLLENAVNYSPEGGAIEVRIRPLLPQNRQGRGDMLPGDEEGNTKNVASIRPMVQLDQHMVEISVHDNGIGIPSGQLKAIFERFQRVDTRLTREVNGLGLGLAICKHIVELHDGIIWVESEFGRGSTFYVCLPMDINE